MPLCFGDAIVIKSFIIKEQYMSFMHAQTLSTTFGPNGVTCIVNVYLAFDNKEAK